MTLGTLHLGTVRFNLFQIILMTYPETGGVPGEVRADPENELIVDGSPAPHTQRRELVQTCNGIRLLYFVLFQTSAVGHC